MPTSLVPSSERAKAPVSARPPRPSSAEHAPIDRPRMSAPPRDYTPRPTRVATGPMAPPTPLSLAGSLASLVASMKPTYLPPLSSDTLRVVVLSGEGVKDPLMLARTGDTTLLIGTGFSQIQNAGKTYSSFPDMRLIESEKDHLTGWVLLESGFDIDLFQMTLEMIGFPFVYGTIDVIAYIRNTVKDAAFLDKCRFFELFSPNAEDRKIADFVLRNTSSGLSISVGTKGCVDALHMIDTTALSTSSLPVLSR
jgi:hypothetical protein